MDTKEFVQFGRHCAKLAKRMPRSIAYTLTSQAAGTRNTAIEEIERTMTVRSKPFVHGRIRYSKATPGELKAEVGSVAKPRFSGFLEQERGGFMRFPPDRAIRLTARGGQVSKRIPPSARLKRSNVFEKPDRYRGKSAHARAVAMIRILSRKGYRKPFIIEGHDRILDGLYKFKGRKNKQKLVQLQQFDERVYVDRDQWMAPAIGNFLKRWDSLREWHYNFGRFWSEK